MKKTFIISYAFIISFLFISQQLFAQRYYKNNPRIYNDPYDLNLTQKQLEKMDKLEIELEKSLSPLFSKLRTNYFKLDELELQRSPDHTKIDKAWEEIYTLEEEIEKKEIAHEENIRGLLTEDQRAVFDSYYGYGMGTGRGYYGRGQGYGSRRGVGTLGQGYYGRGIARGTGRLTRRSYRYDSRIRYGRGPCGAGLGKWYPQGYGRGRWN